MHARGFVAHARLMTIRTSSRGSLNESRRTFDTFLANRCGFEQVFARKVEAYGRIGDLVVALSTSGDSPNVGAASQTARHLGLCIVELLGPGEASSPQSSR